MPVPVKRGIVGIARMKQEDIALSSNLEIMPPAPAGELLSIQVGRVRRHEMPDGVRVDFRDATWSSGIFKSAVSGPVRVSERGIEEDEQADLENHGGPDNVVLAYDADHYPIWRGRLGLPEMEHGRFGENFTV